MSAPKPYHLFISFAFEDEEYATRLEKSLHYWGMKVWFAPLSLVVGDKLLNSINAGLMASEYGVILLSQSYIAKKWTTYELDVLHRQHIENDKKLFPLWHGVDKNQIDAWNPGLSGIVALKSTEGESTIAEKIADVVYQGSPLRAVTPSYEDPQWRFLQGRAEVLANNEDGGAFNLFDAAEFPDDQFPMYVNDIRIGTVRFLPRGVLKKNYAQFDYFDVWLPALAPSRHLMAWAQSRDLTEHWQTFAERYEREMITHTDSRQSLLLIAKLAQITPLSIGCYCSDESCCHRSVLHQLIGRVALNEL